MKRFWMSWIGGGPFLLHSPWWISGTTGADEPIFCAAVVANDEEAAQEAIYSCFDERPASLKFRFVDEKDADWSPFSDRFPRADWMIWPE